jgi:hypothetical protein
MDGATLITQTRGRLSHASFDVPNVPPFYQPRGHTPLRTQEWGMGAVQGVLVQVGVPKTIEEWSVTLEDVRSPRIPSLAPYLTAFAR